ncbi:MAG: hypothetical protein DRQ61_09895 [Gammaproteobacteria bacterium]|nr:MAG: hypothetical protein DRQ61_09895 [Gammaproteobacteria bacterium]
MKYPLLVLLSLLITSSAHAANEQQMIDESKQAIKAFAGQLKSELMAGMKKGGPLEAVNICNTVAEEISRNNSKKLGWEISRTSLKPRNAKNSPEPWEVAVLTSFEKRKEAGEPISEIDHAEVISNNGQSQFRYMKAIPTKSLCLVCHGENIAPDLSRRLDQLYPNDLARNYKPGDIRGAFSITRAIQ